MDGKQIFKLFWKNVKYNIENKVDHYNVYTTLSL